MAKAKKAEGYDFGNLLDPRIAGKVDENALTTVELAERLGLGASIVRRRVRAAIAAGTVERVWKRKINSAGHHIVVEAYRPVQPAKSEGGKK